MAHFIFLSTDSLTLDSENLLAMFCLHRQGRLLSGEPASATVRAAGCTPCIGFALFQAEFDTLYAGVWWNRSHTAAPQSNQLSTLVPLPPQTKIKCF